MLFINYGKKNFNTTLRIDLIKKLKNLAAEEEVGGTISLKKLSKICSKSIKKNPENALSPSHKPCLYP